MALIRKFCVSADISNVFHQIVAKSALMQNSSVTYDIAENVFNVHVA